MNHEPNQVETKASSESKTLILSPAAARRQLLNSLIEAGVILPEDWQALDDHARRRFFESPSDDELMTRLLEAHLLTPYQAARIRAEGPRHLVVGNYRLLDEIGSGGMGVVYRGEHALLRRPVAIKILRDAGDSGETMLQRFFVEMRALARIRHPNVVWALDAGTVKPTRVDDSFVHYLVMEYVTGTNLEHLATKSPLSVSQACELIYQIAGALDETHKLNLVHRDIKPSNILVTSQGVAKLLDFGLALHFGRRRLTMPGTLLGTLGFMAPEQISDAATVDIRTDLFGLGATLFFCLTGACPFSTTGTIANQVAARLTQGPPAVRTYRPDVSPELETIIRRMMATNRDDRYPTPQSVLHALLPFVNSTSRFEGKHRHVDGGSSSGHDADPVRPTAAAAPRIVIADDEAYIRRICKSYFTREGYECAEAADGEETLQILSQREYDIVLLDVDMPKLDGAEALKRLRRNQPGGHLKVIMMSGGVTPDEMSTMLALGADDYLAKPLPRAELVSRVQAALAHKRIQDRSDHLHKQLMQLNADLEATMTARSSDLSRVRKTLLYALARIVQSRTQETPGHLNRIGRYTTALALQARTLARSGPLLNDAFIQVLETCAPLHDIGNVAMPDHILQHSGKLAPEDRIVMQAHTTIGAETLAGVAKKDRSAAAFWQTAIDITRHHHENYDGTGYPDRLAGANIPLAARLVSVADAYDSLRTTSEMGIALSHNAAVEMIVEGTKGRFDPQLLHAFQEAQVQFDEIFRAFPEREVAPEEECAGP